MIVNGDNAEADEDLCDADKDLCARCGAKEDDPFFYEGGWYCEKCADSVSNGRCLMRKSGPRSAIIKELLDEIKRYDNSDDVFKQQRALRLEYAIDSEGPEGAHKLMLRFRQDDKEEIENAIAARKPCSKDPSKKCPTMCGGNQTCCECTLYVCDNRVKCATQPSSEYLAEFGCGQHEDCGVEKHLLEKTAYLDHSNLTENEQKLVATIRELLQRIYDYDNGSLIDAMFPMML